MIHRRTIYASVAFIDPKRINGQYVCINCGKTPLPTRCRKWCSDTCYWKFQEKCNWAHLRMIVLRERDYVCSKCGLRKVAEGGVIQYNELVVDHIVPIALGGEEFNKDNLQVLCKDCNKIKTKEDMGRIALQRKIDKITQNNQTLTNNIQNSNGGLRTNGATA